MLPNGKRNYLIFFFVAAALFWVLAIAGAFRSYSPIPLGDMWDGYLDFYIKASAGDWGVWWKTHNEHRIVLSRLFFWMDLSWFNGSVWFLLALNYALLVFSCFIFWIALKERLPEQYQIPGIFIAIWLSSWSQNENLTWGFQSQFILAQLLPLVAFGMLHRAASNNSIYNNYFIGSCLIGVLSLGTMANGVIVLPLMAAYAIITRIGLWRVLTLATLSCIGLLAYFYDYTSPAYHGSLSSSLKENPFGLILYVITYIGGPFYHIAGGKLGGVILAQVAGGALILISTYISWTSLLKSKRDTLELALLFFILYIGGTALGTGGGRLIFGVDQALSSRYSTPSLMAWAALLVIIAPKLATSSEKIKWQLWLPLSALILAMLPLQFKAWRSGDQSVFERGIAGLAVAIGVNDQLQISRIYPSAERAISIGKAASEQELSYFSRTEYKNIKNAIGKQINGPSEISKVCQGHIDFIEPIENENNYMRVGGWIFNQSENLSPRAIWLIDQKGVVVGYGLVGQPRPDVAEAVDKKASKSGFKGYFLSEAQGASVIVFDPISRCGFSSVLPEIFFTLTANGNKNQVTVDANQVLQNNQWIGTDYHKSRIDGLVVFGSFIQADRDKGEISLQLKRGDRILYRSGPTFGKQYLSLSFSNTEIALPVSLEWRVLDFSSKALPDSFIATFRDNGENRGEWSAIAVLASEVVK